MRFFDWGQEKRGNWRHIVDRKRFSCIVVDSLWYFVSTYFVDNKRVESMSNK